MKSKSLVFLLVTIILIASGLIIWSRFGSEIVDKYFTTPTPTPDPYAGWQTYTNEEYGFSIQYPLEVKLSTQINQSRKNWTTLLMGNYLSKYQEVKATDLYDGYIFGIANISKDINLSFDEYISTIVNDPDYYKVEPINKIKINGINSIWFEAQRYGGPLEVCYFYNITSKSIISICGNTVSEDTYRKNIYDQIFIKIINSFNLY